MAGLQINPELLSQDPTHFSEEHGCLVKVFNSTASICTATAEIMEGPHKGKWTTVRLDRLLVTDESADPTP